MKPTCRIPDRLSVPKEKNYRQSSEPFYGALLKFAQYAPHPLA
ncbi:hypothetical protein RHECNPAF_730016 [Rhizobium etli CNPAF512]|nr:hypothetical protein RHECNPAF_730016 [Rhizobium etli CNPAF512]